MKPLFFILLYLFPITFCFSQDRILDSLKNVKQDTAYVNTLNDICKKMIRSGDLAKADSIALANFSLSEKLGYKRGLAASLYILGYIKQSQADYPKAFNYLFKALNIAEAINDKPRISSIVSAIGAIYFYQRNNPKSLEYYQKSLKIEEELHNKMGIARALTNIGNAYKNMGDSARSKKNLVYAKTKAYPIALGYFFKGLALAEELGEARGVDVNLGNIGSVYTNTGDYDKALEFLNKSLAISKQMDDKGGMAVKLYNIGSVIGQRADSSRNAGSRPAEYKKAIAYLKSSVEMSEAVGDRQGVMEAYIKLSQLYTATGNIKDAFSVYKKHIALRDSIFNTENEKKAVQLEMTYQFDKKEAAAKLEQEKKEALAAAESKRQKTIIASICGILVLVIGFAIFAYRSFLQKQKANIEITRQQEIIEDKQKEILDSIRYAKRIQSALMTSEKYIERNLKRLGKG